MTDKYTETETGVKNILSTLWAIASGTVESIRLSAAERLTLLLSAIAVAAVATILGTAVVLFISIGAAQLLKQLTPQGAYFIIAGFYALLLLLFVAMRRRLVIDPVCRLVTRLLAPPPAQHRDTAQPTDSQPLPTEEHEQDNE